MSGEAAAFDPTRYLRGVAFAAGAGVAYPRLDPSDFARLPIDTWAAAQVPVGVRLEWSGDGSLLVEYRTLTNDLGYRGEGAGRHFSVWSDGSLVAEHAAQLGAGTTRLTGRAGATRHIAYLPEGMKPEITVIATTGDAAPAALQSRWLCYGDSIAEGWNASAPSEAWPARVARVLGLDVVNLGFAGSARGEVVAAEHLSRLRGDVITVAFGVNCWTRIAHSAVQMHANTAAFLAVIRRGHPTTPILVISPIVRPDAEATPNILGATLTDLRTAIETTVSAAMAHDPRLSLLSGADLVPVRCLADGIHPDDEGHALMAKAIAPVLLAAINPKAK